MRNNITLTPLLRASQDGDERRVETLHLGCLRVIDN